MESNTKQRIVDVYRPLFDKFCEDTKDIDFKGISHPFLPLYGEKYEDAKIKIAFVGIESYKWYQEEEYLFSKKCKNGFEEYYNELLRDFHTLEFTTWDNNTGRDFWGFNFKFLKAFHNLKTWTELSDGTNTEILRSIAWGNTHSIERFHVSAKVKEVDYENWEKVQEASKIFDKGENILKSLRPNIMLVFDWGKDYKSWSEGLNLHESFEELQDHLHYYFSKDYDCHIFWTTHPQWLSINNKTDLYIDLMVNLAKEKMK